MRAHIEVTSSVVQSARVLQTAGMFDVPLAEKLTNSWDIDMPIEDQPWSVGLVVGPSGSGKSVLSENVWPGCIAGDHVWSDDRSLLDDFPTGMGVREIIGLLTSVGLGSPPAWVRPYRTLSTGEAFRASVARSLAETDRLVVVDEFTSVVDRQVAQVVSHAVQKAVRRTGRQFVAATCHYDITDWLQPDWVYDVAAGTFTWRSVQPHPPVELRVFQIDRSVWSMFRRHHYLSGDINTSAQCYGGFIGDDLVAFAAYIHFPHAKIKNMKIGHRMVVLPDYQGFGISGRMSELIGQHLYDRGFRYRRVVAHPAVIAYCSRSPRWQEAKRSRSMGGWASANEPSDVFRITRKFTDPRKLSTRSFEYVPPALSP